VGLAAEYNENRHELQASAQAFTFFFVSARLYKRRRHYSIRLCCLSMVLSVRDNTSGLAG